MAKYVKKPIIVDAEQYKPGMEDGFTNKYGCDEGCEFCCEETPYIQTPDGKRWLQPGDWIIKGIEGCRYPIRNHIFELTYEKIKEDDNENTVRP